MPDRHIEYVRLDDIHPAERNAKAHDTAGIARSISHFGFAELPLIDERTGRLVAGHGRHAQLVELHSAGDQPPDGVKIDDDGMWQMPVVRGWSSRSDADAEAYLLASNQLTTKGGWDDRTLAEMLQDLADQQLLELTGFDDDDLRQLLDSMNKVEELPPEERTDRDDFPDPPDNARTQPGDVWLLGPHRVLCGDSTNMTAVDAMLAGDRCHIMWTDPPYGVEYVGKTKDALRIRNDGAADLPDLLAGAFAVATAALIPGAAFYIAHPAGALSIEFARAVENAGWKFRQGLVWVKDTLVLGRSDYHYKHEPILFGYTGGAEGRRGRGGEGWYGDHSQTSVFDVPKPPRSADHPTMKPVELITRALSNSCPAGGLVYEPFGGSGSTLIAAHHHRAEARVVELDPRYVDVICRRWQEHTGQMPVLQSTGEPADFTPDDAERANA